MSKPIASTVAYGGFGIEQISDQGVVAALSSSDIASIVILDITLGGWGTIFFLGGTVCLGIYHMVTLSHKLWKWRQEATRG